MLEEKFSPQPVPFLRVIDRPMNPAQASKTEVLKQLLPGVEAWIFLLVILGLVCVLIFWVRAHWREDADGDASVDKMLIEFQESKREGVLTEEEYRLIKSRLAPRLKPTTVPERKESAEGSPPRTRKTLRGDSSADSAKGVAAPPALERQEGVDEHPG